MYIARYTYRPYARLPAISLPCRRIGISHPTEVPWTPGILYIPRPYASRTRATPVCVVFAPPRPISRAARRESLQCFPKCLAALTGCAERKPPCFSQRRRGAHHGTIHLSRERPASFHAPRQPGVAQASRERTAGRRGSSPKGSHEPSPRATDDERSIAELVVETLEGAGMLTQVCVHASEALPMVREGSFDLIILDVMMPGLDGFELCARMRAESFVPIIFFVSPGRGSR